MCSSGNLAVGDFFTYYVCEFLAATVDFTSFVIGDAFVFMAMTNIVTSLAYF